MIKQKVYLILARRSISTVLVIKFLVSLEDLVVFNLKSLNFH